MFRLKDNIVLYLIFIIILLLSNGSLISAEGVTSGERQPISIRSNMMTLKNMENKAIFEGEVTVIKGDLTLNAHRVEVNFSLPDEGLSSKEMGFIDIGVIGKDNDIDIIEAVGEVRMAQGNRKASAEKAFYYQDEEKIILIGNPEVWDEDYRVTGKKITIYLKEDRSIVEESRVTIRSER